MARDFKKRRKQREPKEFEETVIAIDRVTKVVKGGRRLRFRATVAIGNKKGKIGIGIGKSTEVSGAIQKAIAKAKKCLITVNIDGTTIPHEIVVKIKSSKMIFLPAAPGTGIKAGGVMRKIIDLAGIKDILSKSYGTTNKVNNTKATYEALKMLRRTPIMDKKDAAKKAKREQAAAAHAKAPKAKAPDTKKDAHAKATTGKPAVKKAETK